jgi:hypothetical protein
VRVEEIAADAEAVRGLASAPATGALARTSTPRDPLAELKLPAAFKRGFYVDVFPIVGGDDAWRLQPTAPLQATFVIPSGAFTLGDHLKAGMLDRDGKILVANAEYLALTEGRYSFLIAVGNRTAPPNKDYGECVADLELVDKSGAATPVVDGARSNALFTVGPNALEMPATGGVTLGRGAYRMKLRAACFASAGTDIARDPLAQPTYAIYVRTPEDPVVRPANPGSFVYKLK